MTFQNDVDREITKWLSCKHYHFLSHICPSHISFRILRTFLCSLDIAFISHHYFMTACSIYLLIYLFIYFINSTAYFPPMMESLE